MKQEEAVILCEGYHDRAFWSGMLTFLGCTIPKDPSKAVQVIRDPWGSPVVGGQFGYHTKRGEFVRITPCGGDALIRNKLKARLQERATRTVRHLVVTYDADCDTRSDPTASQGIDSAHHSVQSVLKAGGAPFTRAADGDYILDNGATRVSVVVWWAPDGHSAGVPWKHTLERLVCAALGEVFPGRAQAVEQWLQGRPGAQEAGPKEYAWSNMAGWHAEQGCEAFYSALWSQPQVAAQLQSRLERMGAWRIIQDVAGGP